MSHDTKGRLLEAGSAMLLRHGYNGFGIQRLLDETGVTKGSFYHHFESKQDLALQIVDLYMEDVHQALDACLSDTTRPPLERVRSFFEGTREKYREEGYLGCLLGGIGQELSGASEVFRRKIAECLGEIADRISVCLEEARQRGDLPRDSDPQEMADLLVDCWEGAALRSRLLSDASPLDAMLDFYFGSATPV